MVELEQPAQAFTTRDRAGPDHRCRGVSGVTMPAMDARRRRPRTLPLTARRRRWSSVRRRRRGPCTAEDPVLLEQVVNDRLRVPVDPAGEEKEEEGDRGRQRVHGRRVTRGAAPVQGVRACGIVGPQIGPRFPTQEPPRRRSTRLFVEDPPSAEFSHRTGLTTDDRMPVPPSACFSGGECAAIVP